MKERVTLLSDRALLRFNDWFSSPGGVYQTFLVVLVIVAAEQIWPSLDPHGFVVLYLLTVYSAITQPALAATGRESAERLERLLALIERQITDEAAELDQIEHDLHPSA